MCFAGFVTSKCALTGRHASGYIHSIRPVVITIPSIAFFQTSTAKNIHVCFNHVENNHVLVQSGARRLKSSISPSFMITCGLESGNITFDNYHPPIYQTKT